MIANLLVAGAGILIRAASQAYRQAIISMSRTFTSEAERLTLSALACLAFAVGEA